MTTLAQLVDEFLETEFGHSPTLASSLGRGRSAGRRPIGHRISPGCNAAPSPWLSRRAAVTTARPRMPA